MHVKEKDFPSYLENSLPQEKQKNIRQHLSVCDLCSRKLKEWEMIFGTIAELDFDFPLEGMEQNVLSQIRNQDVKAPEKAVSPRKLVFNLSYVALFIFLCSLFILPYTNIAGISFQKATNFLFNEGLDFINQAKWSAIDVISWLQSMDFANWLLMLSAGIILIVGGTYYSLGGKAVRKA